MKKKLTVLTNASEPHIIEYTIGRLSKKNTDGTEQYIESLELHANQPRIKIYTFSL